MTTQEFKELSDRFMRSSEEIFVGDPLILRKMLCAALSGGHLLFEDLPGLGKTMLAKVFAKATGCQWGRVQFTPDIMPADILGTRVWMPKASEFILEKGPIFTNILLADEINRAPPKTQSALLEAMEERQVTIEGTTYELGRPFFVIATQNPIEHEGTFPLPEAQMDRFIMRMSVGYAKDTEQEMEILRRRIKWKGDDPVAALRPAMDKEQFLWMQGQVENMVFVHESVLNYVSVLVRSTRVHYAVEVGSSPRGGLALLKLSRAYAAMMGRDFVIPDDIKLFAHEALDHRIILGMEYELEDEVSAKGVIDEILDSTEVPKDYRP
jgi:MoxR-like ATPase